MAYKSSSLVYLFAIQFFVSFSAKEVQAKVPAVIVFGDSTVDAGNNNRRFTIAKCNFRPYGQDFEGGKPTGRWSNGRLFTDFISEALGLKKVIPAYLDTDFGMKDFATGVTFASGGAGYDNLTSTLVSAIPLWQELVYFEEFKGRLAKDATDRQKAVFGCLQAPHAQDFLLAIPIEGLGQKMSPLEYRAILKYRLMIPLYPSDARCPACITGCLDAYGEHAVHCKVDPGFKYRHDHVRDTLYDVLWRAGISAKKEAPVNFLTDPLEGRSTLRPADVLIFGWTNGKHACVDLTGVSPLVGIGHGTFTVGQAALRAASGKVTKHEKACNDNGHAFIPFAFDTFGFLAPEAVGLLKRVHKVMHSNVMTPGSREFVFKRMGFAIQKGLAAQLVARLPAKSM